MKRVIFLLLGIAISVVALYLALKGFEFDQLWDAIGQAQPLFLVLMVVPYILTFMTKVWRWKVLFHPDGERLSIGLLFSGLMISYIPLPFRAGEVARGVVVSARSGMPPARVFSTILVEKVLDVLTLLTFLGISLPFVGLPKDMQRSASLLGGGFLVIALILLVLVLRPNLARALVRQVAVRLPARLGPRIETATENALQGLAPLSNGPVALRLVLWSLATWGVNTVTVYLMMRAFNIEVPYMASVVLVVATNLGMAVPSAPGYVGVFEAVVVAALTILNVPLAQAQTFALVYHFIGLVPVATLGAIAALQQGIGMAAFRGESNTAPAQAPEPNPARPVAARPAVPRDKR